ncbi:MAG: IPTL-CTERM sorting domain-containing protein [Lysobacterales bacterium]|jgi:uncharacterized repeat protein (TIGR01451 family)
MNSPRIAARPSAWHIVSLTILALLFSSSAMAVDCSSANISLTSQTDIDNFQTDYGGGGTCDTVTGDLYIQDTNATNLDGLSALTSVGGGFLIVNNTALTDISGLSSLTNVGGHLFLRFNSALTQVDGLSSLVTVGESFLLQENGLINVNGLSSLSSVGMNMGIDGENALTNLAGLSGLVSVGNDVIIQLNDNLADVSDLSSLATIGGDLYFLNDDALTNVSGLSSLASIGGDLYVGYNDSLTAVDGFSALTSVGGNLTFPSNPILADVNGLSNLISVASDVSVTDNASLSLCTGLTALLDTVDDGDPGPGVDPVPDVGGTVTLSGNLFGCNSIGEALHLVDLVLSVTDTPDPVLAGSGPDNLTYTLELENLGPWDATTVSVSVVPSLPTGVTVSGSTASAGTSFDGSTWTVGALPAGDPSVTLELSLTVDGTASSCTDCISVTATATADQDDSDPANNTDVASATSIERAADAPTSFDTTIVFTNGYEGTGSVTLTCNNGEPLVQTFDISPGLPVNFVITQLDFVDPDVNCQVTLDAIDDGYVGSSFTANAVLTDGACLFSATPEAGEAPFNLTLDRANTCEIVAEPVASTFEVSKQWLFEGNSVNDGSDISQDATIHVYCSPAAINTGPSFGQVDWWAYPNGDDGFSYGFYPSPEGGTTCYAVESGLDSSVESDQGCASGTDFEVGDGTKGCTITNTVFFEGIPTLSHWGLAILAVLTLGVGLVGFRRFA